MKDDAVALPHPEPIQSGSEGRDTLLDLAEI
jgi:hypothetical protein